MNTIYSGICSSRVLADQIFENDEVLTLSKMSIDEVRPVIRRLTEADVDNLELCLSYHIPGYYFSSSCHWLDSLDFSTLVSYKNQNLAFKHFSSRELIYPISIRDNFLLERSNLLHDFCTKHAALCRWGLHRQNAILPFHFRVALECANVQRSVQGMEFNWSSPANYYPPYPSVRHMYDTRWFITATCIHDIALYPHLTLKMLMRSWKSRLREAGVIDFSNSMCNHEPLNELELFERWLIYINSRILGYVHPDQRSLQNVGVLLNLEKNIARCPLEVLTPSERVMAKSLKLRFYLRAQITDLPKNPFVFRGDDKKWIIRDRLPHNQGRTSICLPKLELIIQPRLRVSRFCPDKIKARKQVTRYSSLLRDKIKVKNRVKHKRKLRTIKESREAATRGGFNAEYGEFSNIVFPQSSPVQVVVDYYKQLQIADLRSKTSLCFMMASLYHAINIGDYAGFSLAVGGFLTKLEFNPEDIVSQLMTLANFFSEMVQSYREEIIGPQAEGDDEPKDWFEYLKSQLNHIVNGDLDKLVTSPLGKKFAKLFAVICSAPIFLACGIFPDKGTFDSWYKTSLEPKIAVVTFGAIVFAFIGEFIKTGIPFLKGVIGINEIRFGDKVLTLHNEFNTYIINKSDTTFMVKLKLYDENGVPQFAMSTYLDSLMARVTDLQAESFKLENRVYLALLGRMTKDLVSELALARAYLAAATARSQPYMYVIVGPSNIQKTSLNKILMQILFHLGAPAGEEEKRFSMEYVANYNPAHKHADNVTNETRILNIDDIGKYRVESIENPTTSSLMEVVNTETNLVNKADLSSKGSTYFRHSGVTATSNNYDLGQFNFHTYQIAAYRRCALVISPVLTRAAPVYSSNTDYIPPALLHREGRMYVLEKYVGGQLKSDVYLENVKTKVKRKIDTTPQVEKLVDGGTNAFTFDEMLDYFRGDITNYFEITRKVAADTDKMMFTPLCACGVPKAVCKCTYEAELNLNIAPESQTDGNYAQMIFLFVLSSVFGFQSKLSLFCAYVSFIIWYYDTLLDCAIEAIVWIVLRRQQLGNFSWFSDYFSDLARSAELREHTTHQVFEGMVARLLVKLRVVPYNLKRRLLKKLMLRWHPSVVLTQMAEDCAANFQSLLKGKVKPEVLVMLVAMAGLSWYKFRAWKNIAGFVTQSAGESIPEATKKKAEAMNISFGSGVPPTQARPSTRPKAPQSYIPVGFLPRVEPEVDSIRQKIHCNLRHLTVGNGLGKTDRCHCLIIDQSTILFPHHMLYRIDYPENIVVTLESGIISNLSEGGEFIVKYKDIKRLYDNTGNILDTALMPLGRFIMGTRSILKYFLPMQDYGKFSGSAELMRLSSDCKSIMTGKSSIVGGRIKDKVLVAGELMHPFVFEYQNIAPSGPGTCGTVVCLQYQQSYYIAGIHSLGTLNNLTGYCEQLYCEQLTQAIAGIPQDLKGLNVEDNDEYGGLSIVTQDLVVNSCLHHIDQGYGRKLATAFDLRNKEMRNTFVPTIINHLVADEVVVVPMRLESFIDEEGLWHSPLSEGASNKCRPPNYFHPELLQAAIADMEGHITSVIDMKALKLLKPLDLDSNVRGVPGFMNGLNLNTAAGAGLQGKKRNYVYGFHGIELCPDENIIDAINNVFSQWKQNKSAKFINKLSTKNETRKVGKEARIFYASQTTFVMLTRMFLGPVMEFIMQFRDDLEIAVGINCGSPDEVAKLVDFMLKGTTGFPDSNSMDTDGKEYDLSNDVLLEALWWFYEFIKKYCPLYNEEALWALRCLIRDFPNLVNSVNGDLFMAALKTPSGWGGTTFFNCICMMIYFRMMSILCYSMHIQPYIFEESGWSVNWPDLLRLVPKFRSVINLKVYGDDVIFTVRAGVNFLTPKAIADAFKLLRLPMTAADKSDELKYKRLSECEFLKRYISFDVDTQTYHMALQRSSIMKSLAYRDSKSSLAPPEHLRVVLEQSLTQMFLRGREEFEEHKLFVRKCLDVVEQDPEYASTIKYYVDQHYEDIKVLYLSGSYFDDSL